METYRLSCVVKSFFLACFFFFTYACSDSVSDDLVLSFNLQVNESDVQRFTWGESRTFPVQGINIDRIDIISCPKGWVVTAGLTEIKVTAPQAILGTTPTTGEIVFNASCRGKSESLSLAVEIPASMFINLNDPSLFNNSEIVWAKKPNGDTLAQVCREYVRMERVTGGQGTRTIVVYLYDSSSKTFSKGFVTANGGMINHDGSGYQIGAGNETKVVYIADNFCCLPGNYENIPMAKLEPETVNDIEGNTYGIVKIGTQYWMRENLRTMRYNDGTEIGKNCMWYKDDFVDIASSEKLKKQFGQMYFSSAAANAKLAPEGWRVAGDKEWMTLEFFLGMKEQDAYSDLSMRADGVGALLKSEGQEWADNGGGTNLSGLGIVPAGLQFGDGGRSIKSFAYLHSGSYQIRLLSGTYSTCLRKLGGGPAFSVRCIRNE